MKNQALNPFLPSFEYIPDGEPHVFGNRIYLYGSHDRFNGNKFCMNDYVSWSADTNDLKNWQKSGVIFKKTQDPDNENGAYELWAPDVTRGADGKYYLYYCLANYPKIGVAVCDTPDGEFRFIGHVKDEQGKEIGQREGDTLPFDPAVLVDDDKRVWLYAGNDPAERWVRKNDKKASVVMELAPDMLTVIGKPKKLIPSVCESKGTSFFGHEFFEASSIRKFNGRYYFIYSSVAMHELCYATSDRPDGGFTFGGVLVSNGDIRQEDGYVTFFGCPANRHIKYYIGNNHGSVAKVGGEYYIFYHRHTNRIMFSRQACAERIEMKADGSFVQAEMTSCGLNGGALFDEGTYEAGKACHLWSKRGALFSAHPLVQNQKHPAITQEGEDREDNPRQYVQNMRDGATAGYKYFDFLSANYISVTIRGSGSGTLVVRDGEKGNVVSEIAVSPKKEWTPCRAALNIEKGVKPLYFTFSGKGSIDFSDFTLGTEE